MQIPLDQFEQVIDEKILKRGLSCFKKGLVRELDEVSPGQLEAVVEGSEDYTVQLAVKNNVVVEHSCNCPYDFGPVCKHVAAVIFAMQEEKLELTKPKQGRKKNSSAPKKKSIATQVAEVLEKASREELLQLIQCEAKRNPSFRNQILADLEHYTDNMSKEMYDQRIKSVTRAAMGRYGYIDYQGSITVGYEVGKILGTARKYLEKQQFQKVLPICFSVLERMSETINEADDSNGDIGGCICEACEILNSMATNCNDEVARRLIFDYCTHQFETKVFAGWDWHMSMLYIAEGVADSEEDCSRIIALTELPQHSDYGIEECQVVKYRTLMKTKGKTVADAFLHDNIQNYRLRRMAVEMAFENKDYGTATKLAEDGLEQDKDKYGLAMDWYDCLLKIAQQQNDTDKIVKYSRWLLINNRRVSNVDYYKILKQNVKPEDWNTFVEDVIKDVRNKKGRFDRDLVAKIYIAEEWWPRLLELVKNSAELYVIEKYEPYLSKDYSKELADLYSLVIPQYLDRNKDRAAYQSACRYIRRIIKLGERAKADSLIATLREQYPKRSALMDELDRV